MLTPPPLVVVGCGATKHPSRTPAGDMYLGSYHLACRRAAARVTSSKHTLILSALHGLLALDEEVEPYDLRMGEPGSVTPEHVRQQAVAKGVLDAAQVVVLAPAAYATVAGAVWPHAQTPLAGVGGIGMHLKVLADIAHDPQCAVPYVQPTPGPGLIEPGVRVETISSVRRKGGGPYGGTLVAITGRTAVVACYDGTQRRFRTEHLQVDPDQMLLDAWKHLGYIDPSTGRPTTDHWTWLTWTVAQHLSAPSAGKAGSSHQKKTEPRHPPLWATCADDPPT